MIDNQILVTAARAERDHRAASYPARIAEGKSDPEAASVDYQCWVALTEWLETGRFMGFHGGADPEGLDAPVGLDGRPTKTPPWISWPELEIAAHTALVLASAKCDRLMVGSQEDESYTEASARRARLVCVHRKVQLRRQLIDSINAEFRARRTTKSQPQQEIAA